MLDLKSELRNQGYQQRDAQTNKTRVSELICQRLIELPAYQQAATIMCYLHCRSEVRTDAILNAAMADNKRCIIPYCTHDQQNVPVLGLWPFNGYEELVQATWGILEPPSQRWHEQEKQVDVSSLDLILVPGVAFSKNGARLGNGVGYYDRLLNALEPHTRLIGVCYEAQLVQHIPMQSHDVFMHAVLTESALYLGNGR